MNRARAEKSSIYISRSPCSISTLQVEFMVAVVLAMIALEGVQAVKPALYRMRQRDLARDVGELREGLFFSAPDTFYI